MTYTRINIDMAEAAVKLRQAFDEKKLSIFNPDNLECAYRCEDGSMCGIGAIMPDSDVEAYLHNQETIHGAPRDLALYAFNCTRVDILDRDLKVAGKDGKMDWKFLRSIQSLHDDIQLKKKAIADPDNGENEESLRRQIANMMKRLSLLIDEMRDYYVDGKDVSIAEISADAA